jgi:ribose transport system permease protein
MITSKSPFRRLVNVDWLGLLGVVLAACLIMSIVTPAFRSNYNLWVLLRDVAITLLVGLSQMIVLAIGQMNLSVGYLGGLVVVITGGLMEVWHLPIGVAVAVGILVGALGGLLNGFLIVRTGINSFIVTIATGSIFLGLNFGLTEARPFYNMPREFVAFGQGRMGFFPPIGFITILVTVMMAILMSRMVPGRQILAVGGNLAAAETSGIPIKNRIVLAHVISGVLAAIAGIMLMARLGQAQPNIGQTWLLMSFAVPIIGGVALTGGSVTIVGTILAAFLISIIQDALVLLNVDPYYVQFFLGLLILAAVGFDRLSKERRRPQKGGAR